MGSAERSGAAECSEAYPTPSVEGEGYRFSGFEPTQGSRRGAAMPGRVAEWLKAHDWKSCGRKPAWVRIPLRP